MARNVEGEFEVLLGNRQLLSLFFIVVILFGVFFTMGYVLGRNTGTRSEAPVAASRLPEAPARQAAGGFAETAVEPAPSPSTAPPSSVEPAPAQPLAAPPETAARPQPPELETASAVVSEPSGGQTYLQVVAGKRPEAELIIEVLKKKGFPARLAPGPSEAMFRVLVGPLPDASAVTATRADLEKAGFTKPVLRRY
jgi:cell division septation protein DedD